MQDPGHGPWSQDFALIPSIMPLSPKVRNVNVYLKFWGEIDKVFPKS